MVFARLFAAGRRIATEERLWIVPSRERAKLRAVAWLHGVAGPWAVAGFRMGESALRLLSLERASRDLAIEHFSPFAVQYTCIIDGVAAATGASLGKLNLKLVDAPTIDTRTVYRRPSTGVSVEMRVTASFARRFGNVPRGRRREAGRVVIRLPDHEIFDAIAGPSAPGGGDARSPNGH
jgi:formylmethanofuran dehydrogenase subunit E